MRVLFNIVLRPPIYAKRQAYSSTWTNAFDGEDKIVEERLRDWMELKQHEAIAQKAGVPFPDYLEKALKALMDAYRKGKDCEIKTPTMFISMQHRNSNGIYIDLTQ